MSIFEQIAGDHYMTLGERRDHPRFLMGSDLDVSYPFPGITDYECASCHTAFPCDAFVLAEELSKVRDALHAFVERNEPTNFRVYAMGYTTCWLCNRAPHADDCLVGKAAIVLGDTKDTVVKAGSRTPRG